MFTSILRFNVRSTEIFIQAGIYVFWKHVVQIYASWTDFDIFLLVSNNLYILYFI